MSFLEKFGPHLPYLRRYARALTGSQDKGDACVRTCLSALAADPSRLNRELSAPVSLYSFFHTVWSDKLSEQAPVAEAGLTIADERLLSLAPVQRQAFLLLAVERFSRDEVGAILGRTPSEVETLLAQAHLEIEADLSTKVLIIEDEPIIAADLEAMVGELGHDFVGNATTRTDAVEMARATRPGLILCDIQLADNSSGIDASADILKEMDVPVIFITAFPERLLTGEGAEPTYLIPKPFQENTVKATIGQALFFHPSSCS
jgi:DNA-directed RNA polymerase specialized sigma24 family protein